MSDEIQNESSIVKEYYATGELKSEYSLLGKLKQGPYRAYWRNGKIKTEMFFENDVAVGITRSFDRDGVLWQETVSLGGLNNWDSKTFYKSGKLSGEGRMRMPISGTRKDVAWVERNFYENGQLALECSHAPGDEKSINKAWNEDGRELSSLYEIALVKYRTSNYYPEEDLWMGHLVELGDAGLQEHRLTEARKFAEETKSLLERNCPTNMDVMLFLGQIALLDGKTKEAGEYLLAAARKLPFENVTYSNFCPEDMALAKGLLEKGETEVVIEFINLYSKWYRNQDIKDQLRRWIDDIKGGTFPVFSGIRN